MTINNQPIKGLLAFVLVVSLSLAICTSLEPAMLGSWVAFLFMACIPTQIVCGAAWQTERIQRLGRIQRGLTLLAITVLGGCVFATLILALFGGDHSPTPPVIMYTILTVASAFWLVAVWQMWPASTMTTHPVALGISVLVLCYALAYALFASLFDFSFLAGAPVYIESQDPKGMFMAWQAMAFIVTSVAVIMFCVLCDFWPVSTSSLASSSALAFKLIATIYILIVSSIIFYVATSVLKIDYVIYMVRGPVCFLFGAFILLNMLENSLFSGMPALSTRIFRVVACIALALAMQILYQAAASAMVGELASGAPTYDIELWLANAMLGVTFPLIVTYTDFFGFWPLASAQPAEIGSEPEAA